MPQITLEYTSNIGQRVDADELMKGVHELVARIVDLPIGNCKSRVNVCNVYRVGTGGADKAFVHAEVRILSGRPPATKKELGQRLLDFLQDYFKPASESIELQITTEIQDIERDAYSKWPEGTLSQDSP